MDAALVILIAAFGIALVFEFINGFHDTANAVATVIYTHSLRPVQAVVWSGLWNFVGVLLSSGAVALSIYKLAAPEALAADQVGALAALIAIPLAATLWNFATWYAGLPASSSHTMIGSILGVALMRSWMQGQGGAGVNWAKAGEIGLSLLVSPFAGFVIAALLFYALRAALTRAPALFEAADAATPPPAAMRGLLIATSAAVSFAHGTNDGQKGIGLFMLILIVAMPGAYGLGADGALIVPVWVKVLTAFVLGGGTMVGWRRIVVTVGEKIGKIHMSSAQGAAAEITAALTIQAASLFGMPVSTTHVLSSGIAGTMFAQGAGVQKGTVGKILLAWILTVPASIFISSFLFGGLTFAFVNSFAR